MAEQVQLHVEQMLPELEQMQRVGLLDRKEIRKLVQKRKEFEYKLHRRVKCKEDTLKYIQFEINLLALIKQRRERIGYFHKMSEIDHTISNRIHRLFKNVVFRNQYDVNLWMSHIAFLEKQGWHGAVSQAYVRILQVHNDKPDLWISAAKWELTENKSPDNARKLMLRALKFHPSNQDLFSEYFRLELLYVEQLLKRQKVLGIENMNTSSQDSVLRGEIALVVYEEALAKIPHPSLVVRFIDIAHKFGFTAELQQRMFRDLEEKFPTSEITWDTLARRALEKDNYKDPPSLKDRLRHCWDKYEEGLKATEGSETMWSYYVETCMEMIHASPKLMDIKQTHAIQVMRRAESEGKLPERFYSDLVRHLDPWEGVKVITRGNQSYASSLTLWDLHIQLLLDMIRHKEAIQVFWEAIVHLSKSEIPKLWDSLSLALKSWESNSDVEALFCKALKSETLAKHVKAEFLQWTSQHKGVNEARRLYKEQAYMPPFCLQFHLQMINIEGAQEKPNAARIRKLFEAACDQFGKTDADLWLQYLKWEEEKGNPNRVGHLYSVVQKTLEPNNFQEFLTHHTLKRIKS